jgi:hypothetical protein
MVVIGGEHVFKKSLIRGKSVGYLDFLKKRFCDTYNIEFTFGGYYSLLAIVDFIIKKNNANFSVLLPSYLCPSMLKPFDLRSIKYDFYEVDDNLLINSDHLLSAITPETKAVLFIDYFGASQSEQWYESINEIRTKGIYIIQDVVQCLDLIKTNIYGDFIFNSFRKFIPVEGSILLSKQNLDIIWSNDSIAELYLKRLGQYLRRINLKINIIPSYLFIAALNKFEQNYYKTQVYLLPDLNKDYINKVDIFRLIDIQIKNYSCLEKSFSKLIPQLLLNQSGNFTPLGFVIKVKKRDSFRKYLAKNRIFAPIHWQLSDKIDKIKFGNSWKLSESIVTIPIINIGPDEMNYLIEKLNHYFEKHEDIS